MILSPLLFMPSLYSNLKNFYITCPHSFLITISDATGATIAMLQAAKKDYVVYTPVPVAKHAVSYMNAKCTYYAKSCKCAASPHHTFSAQRDR